MMAPAAEVPAMPTLPAPTQEVHVGSPATVVVKAPTDVRLTVNGQPTTLRGTQETFSSPNLEPGRSYSYLFKAEAVRDGKTVSLTRRVVVRAGQEARVDLTNLESGNGLPEDVARVTVLVPATAELFIDGVRYPSTSEKRSFETPRLEPGRSYYYTLRAEVTRDGQPRSESQRVIVRGGKEVTVDFKELRSEQAARR
jgi:uncharacterized protein (TIGR03000 family)